MVWSLITLKQRHCFISEDLTEYLFMAETIAVTPHRTKAQARDRALCAPGVSIPCRHQRVEPETLESGRKAVMAL